VHDAGEAIARGQLKEIGERVERGEQQRYEREALAGNVVFEGEDPLRLSARQRQIPL
jgi:hypothetical protein